MMGRLMLILGGARSGKSSISERMAREWGGRVTFVATAEAHDDEMRQRIKNHQAARPADWHTVEEPLDLAGAVRKAAMESDTVLVDCLTLWLSNRLCRLDPPASDAEWGPVPEQLTPELEETAAALLDAARTGDATILVVSNEVGLGLVPPNPMGRVYRDLLGYMNRRLAAEADQVLLMVAGLPLDVKRLALGGLP
jgi:adenosylcobinamide kinase / adenosylcobinamide-phosphate guanylyltransferase